MDSVTCLDWYQFHQKNYIEHCAERKEDFSADMCDKNHKNLNIIKIHLNIYSKSCFLWH